MALQITILTVGKLKNSHIEWLEADYLKRINLFKINFIELKTFPDDREKEGESVLKKIQEIKNEFPHPFTILLCEDGESLDGVEFSKKLFSSLQENHKKNIIFVIGGALGHSLKLRREITTHWSLSQLTFPHQLVRLILVEQIYRAQTIYTGHPYHH